MVLEDMLVSLELGLSKHNASMEKLQLYQRFRYAVEDVTLLGEMIRFMESAPLNLELLNELTGKLRMVTRFGLPATPGVGKVEDGVLQRQEAPAGKGVLIGKSGFYAKTFFIAAHLHFDLTGQESEYGRLSVQIKELEGFVKEQFGAGELPGTFYDLKGYSYKPILAGKNSSQKGQLKPCFGQIAKHPDVFGKEVAEMAQSILLQHFE